MNIDELLEIIKKTELPVPENKNGYCIEGDIYKFQKYNNKYLGTVYQKPGRNGSSISFYIEDPKVISWVENPANKHFLTNLHGCRVKLRGTLKLYQDKIQFLCNFVEFLNEPSFAKKIFVENESMFEHSFLNQKEQEQNLKDFKSADSKFIKIEKIALIANKLSKGKDDFFAESSLTKDIVYESISLSAENIVTQIKKYTDSSDISMICIVRGGGDLYNDLFDFEDKEILNAVMTAKNKGKFILCGIGHSSDKLTILQLADIRAKTPHEAGEIVKEFLSNKTSIKNLEYKINELTNELENNNKQKLSQLTVKNAQISNLNDDIDTLKKQLDKHNNETENLNKQIQDLKSKCKLLVIVLIGIICYIAYSYFFK